MIMLHQRENTFGGASLHSRFWRVIGSLRLVPRASCLSGEDPMQYLFPELSPPNVAETVLQSLGRGKAQPPLKCILDTIHNCLILLCTQTSCIYFIFLCLPRGLSVEYPKTTQTLSLSSRRCSALEATHPATTHYQQNWSRWPSCPF